MGSVWFVLSQSCAQGCCSWWVTMHWGWKMEILFLFGLGIFGSYQGLFLALYSGIPLGRTHYMVLGLEQGSVVCGPNALSLCYLCSSWPGRVDSQKPGDFPAAQFHVWIGWVDRWVRQVTQPHRQVSGTEFWCWSPGFKGLCADGPQLSKASRSSWCVILNPPLWYVLWLFHFQMRHCCSAWVRCWVWTPQNRAQCC